jgi:hypothetical protein
MDCTAIASSSAWGSHSSEASTSRPVPAMGRRASRSKPGNDEVQGLFIYSEISVFTEITQTILNKLAPGKSLAGGSRVKQSGVRKGVGANNCKSRTRQACAIPKENGARRRRLAG